MPAPGRSWLLVFVGGGSETVNVFRQGGGAAGVDIDYQSGNDRVACTFNPGGGSIDTGTDSIEDGDRRLIALAACWDYATLGCRLVVNGRLAGTTTTSGVMGGVSSSPRLWDAGAGDLESTGVLLLATVGRALTVEEAAAWTRDPFGPLRPWRRTAAGGPTTHALSGSLATSLALDGPIEVERALAGELATAVDVSSALDVRRAVAGTLPLDLEFGGDLEISGAVALSGSLPLDLEFAAPVEVDRALGGSLPLALALGGPLSTGPDSIGDVIASDAPVGTLTLADLAHGAIALADTAHGSLEVSDG